jgi:hypothetical protein
MKTFNRQPITLPPQPMPKINQIWEDNFGILFQVKNITDNGVQAKIKYENGREMMLGFGWFDGINYKFIGNL